MLIEISSSVFRKASIRFHEGLNVVLGDENATNSIGKSSFLMIIDFGFGGRSLLEHNADLVTELGHHEYFFTFVFEGEVYRFGRKTSEPSVVYRYDEELQPTGHFRVEEFTGFLKRSYQIELADTSFRALVGLHTRVWGKDNLNVHRPLHTSQSQASSDCVDNLLKVFGLYDSIAELARQLSMVQIDNKAMKEAMRRHVVPSIGKQDYANNQKRIEDLNEELEDIKANLAKYATNISEVVSREVLELKAEKDQLLDLRLTIAGRLQRTESNLSENRHIRSKSFADLIKYVPDIDQGRLAKVEEFHNNVARLLKAELQESERELRAEVSRIDSEIARIDAAMTESIKSVRQPTKLVDRVVALATSLEDASKENKWFERSASLRTQEELLRSDLASEKDKVLRRAESEVNGGMRAIVTSVFGATHKSPWLQLRETNYSFDVYEDTGTGTAYASLLVLDLTIFLATQLPIVVHDSLLFKNIENDSVARLVQVYMKTNKQSFVALDEIEKYGDETAGLLRAQSVIQLNDRDLLFTKDWRR